MLCFSFLVFLSVSKDYRLSHQTEAAQFWRWRFFAGENWTIITLPLLAVFDQLNHFVFQILTLRLRQKQCRFIKVHLTPKYFFRSNKSLHLFDTYCPPFNPNLDFLQAVKGTTSGHHLAHDRASKRYGSIPGLTSQTSLHACLQRLNTM